MRHLRVSRGVLRRRLDAGSEARQTERALHVRRHRPAAVTFGERHVLERRPPQPASGREKRDRLDEIGLAGAVRTRPARPGPPRPRSGRRDSCGNWSASGGGCGRQAWAGNRATEDEKKPRRSRAPRSSRSTVTVGDAPVVTPASASARRARPWCRGPGSASASRDRRASAPRLRLRAAPRCRADSGN